MDQFYRHEKMIIKFLFAIDLYHFNGINFVIFGWRSPSRKYFPNSCCQRPYIRLKTVFCGCEIRITFWRYPIYAAQYDGKNRRFLYYTRKENSEHN